MDVNDYCKGVEQELAAWKAKLYDANRKLDQLAGKEKEKILGNLGDLNIIVTEMEDRIAKLRNECPTEWSPVKEEIDEAHVDMRSKYEETMELLGKAAPVSIPG
ncbi:MAG: hypothetical protein PVI06_06955 [Desulfobacterales bacterium]|jgi:hypothetical protein